MRILSNNQLFHAAHHSRKNVGSSVCESFIRMTIIDQILCFKEKNIDPTKTSIILGE